MKNYSNSTYSGTWNGSLGPLRIYNRELSLSELKYNFEVGRTKFGV